MWCGGSRLEGAALQIVAELHLRLFRLLDLSIRQPVTQIWHYLLLMTLYK